MAKTRMTNADREAIANKITAHKYDPLFAAAEAQRKVLAQKIYNDVYDEKTRAWIAQAPKGALGMSNNLQINVAGQRRTVYFGKDVVMPVFNKHDGWGPAGVAKAYPAGHELGEAWVAVDTHAMRDEFQKALGMVTRALAGFRTFEDAAEGWPEASTFIMDRARLRVGNTSTTLPAVEIKAINAALDLPPETKQPIGAAQPKS
jgi:hypothetical protein